MREYVEPRPSGLASKGEEYAGKEPRVQGQFSSEVLDLFALRKAMSRSFRTHWENKKR